MDMHFCTCRINLAGQGFTIVDILASEPMSWPEIQIMMALHRDENVWDITPVAIGNSDPAAEKRRLAAKYRATPVVEQIFPGRTPNMDLLMPGQPTDQPRADEYGIPLPAAPDDEEVLGREPPTGPAVFKPGLHRRSIPDTPIGAS
jgi:hypothetical protein